MSNEYSNDANFGLVLPFGIDSGELDGMSPQDIFTRGFEMGMVYGAGDQMERGGSMRFMFHSDNEERVESAALKQGCNLSTKWENDDWLSALLSK